MKLILLVLRSNWPADFAAAGLSIIFAFHQLHLKYDGLN
jgi:hypothetical protein